MNIFVYTGIPTERILLATKCEVSTYPTLNSNPERVRVAIALVAFFAGWRRLAGAGWLALAGELAC